MTDGQRWMTYGDVPVAVLERRWPEAPALPYRKTFRLRPGEAWDEADVSTSLRERYTLVDGEVVPVGVAIAREAVEDGATWAFATETFALRVVLLGPDLVCAAPEGAVAQLLGELREANGGGLGGLPDVIGGLPGGGVLMREAHNVASRDRLGSVHHEFARRARDLLGDRLDLAVVEWGGAAAPRAAVAS
ncbi:MAG: hypothetical protein GEV08_04830 [Acidimicrobiia bacterium]|nr:hypothetical protein [Acidimicrobiia bacterium]